MIILTPTRPFPDPDLEAAMRDVGLALVARTVGEPDVLQALSFEGADGTTARYLLEPELELPVITFAGPSDALVRAGVATRVEHVEPLHAAIGYDATASLEVKVSLLRILSAHALEQVTEPMIRVAALAARDASPFVRLGVPQLLQYAHHPQVAEVVRTMAADPDPDVRAFAGEVLARFDDQPVSAARSGEFAFLALDEAFEVSEEALFERLLAACDELDGDFVEDARAHTATQTWTRFLDADGDTAITLWEDRTARVRYLELQLPSQARLKKALAAFRRHFATVNHAALARRLARAAPDEEFPLTLFYQLAYSAPAKVPRPTIELLDAALASAAPARR